VVPPVPCIFDVAIALSHQHVHGWWMVRRRIIVSHWERGRSATRPFRAPAGVDHRHLAIFKGAADLVAAFSYRDLENHLASP